MSDLIESSDLTKIILEAIEEGKTNFQKIRFMHDFAIGSQEITARHLTKDDYQKIADKFAEKNQYLDATLAYAHIANFTSKNIEEKKAALYTAFSFSEKYYQTVLNNCDGNIYEARNELYLVNSVKEKYAELIKEEAPEEYKKIMLSVAEAYHLRHDAPNKDKAEKIYLDLGEHKKAADMWIELRKDCLDTKGHCNPLDDLIHAVELLRKGNIIKAADELQTKIYARLKEGVKESEESFSFSKETLSDEKKLKMHAGEIKNSMHLKQREPCISDVNIPTSETMTVEEPSQDEIERLRIHCLNDMPGKLSNLYYLYGNLEQISSPEESKFWQAEREDAYKQLIEILADNSFDNDPRVLMNKQRVASIVEKRDKKIALQFYEKTNNHQNIERLCNQLLSETNDPAEKAALKAKILKSKITA